MKPKDFTHLDTSGKPNMVDVSDKTITKRSATAQAIIKVPKSVLDKLQGGDIISKKGPVFQTAIIAGVMGAKKTAELIPFCHPLSIEDCQINISIVKKKIQIDATVTTTGKTGVEMEALTAVHVAALTVYDMCKALSHDIIVEEIKLLEKSGGKKDFKRKT
jgi:cyclic pyranopterin monophosphate synthase